MAEQDVPSALSFMGVTGSTPFDAPSGSAASPSPKKASRKRRRMASPEEVAAALPELQSRCARIVFDDRRGEEGANLLNLLKVYRHWYEDCLPGPAADSLDERILHVEKAGGSHSVRNALMQLGGRAIARERKIQSNTLSSTEAAVAATRAEVVDEAEKSRSALFFGGVFEGNAALSPTENAAPLDEATMKKIEANRKAAMEKRRAREEARRREAALIEEAESLMGFNPEDDVDMTGMDVSIPRDIEDELEREMAEKARRFEELEKAEAEAREKAETGEKEGEKEGEKRGGTAANSAPAQSVTSPARSSRSQGALSPNKRSKSPIGKRRNSSQEGQGSAKKGKGAFVEEEEEENA